MHSTLRVASVSALLLALSSVVACSDDAEDTPAPGGGSSGAISSSGGSSSGDGTSSGGSSSGGSSGTAACTNPATELGQFPATVRGLHLTTDAFITYDPSGGPDTGNPATPKRGALLSMPKVGGAPANLFVPADDEHALGEVIAEGNDVFFLQSDRSSDSGSVLHRISAAGGAATPLAAQTFDDFSILAAIDATNVYLTTDTMLGAGIYKIPRAGGAPVLIADLDETSLGDVQVFGTDVWFASSQGGGSVYKTPISATQPSQQVVFDGDHPCLTGFTRVADGFLCNEPLAISKVDDAFASRQPIYQVLDVPEDGAGMAPKVYGVDGQNVYFGALSPLSKRVTFRTFVLGETSHRALACDVATVAAARHDASGIYLLEGRAPEGQEAPSWSVKRIARP